jgi:hypothetical protein
MLARKPRMLVITALANKMARTVWALMAMNEIYRAPVVAAKGVTNARVSADVGRSDGKHGVTVDETG